MARVTNTEDCLDNVDNRFELILVASKCARQLAKGIAEPLVDVDNDKPTVLALREIAAGKITTRYPKSARAQLCHQFIRFGTVRRSSFLRHCIIKIPYY